MDPGSSLFNDPHRSWGISEMCPSWSLLWFLSLQLLSRALKVFPPTQTHSNSRHRTDLWILEKRIQFSEVICVTVNSCQESSTPNEWYSGWFWSTTHHPGVTGYSLASLDDCLMPFLISSYSTALIWSTRCLVNVTLFPGGLVHFDPWKLHKARQWDIYV